MDRAPAGCPLRMLTVVDEHARECLAIQTRRNLRSTDVQDVLGDLFLIRGCFTHICSDNRPEFIARSLRQWFTHLEIAPLFIEPISPWEDGYVESFNGCLRTELLIAELFYTLRGAQVVIERRRQTDNRVRPHSTLDYRPPTPETIATQLTRA